MVLGLPFFIFRLPVNSVNYRHLLVRHLCCRDLYLVRLVVFIKALNLVPFFTKLNETPAVNLSIVPHTEHHIVVSIIRTFSQGLGSLAVVLSRPECSKNLIFCDSITASKRWAFIAVSLSNRNPFVHHAC